MKYIFLIISFNLAKDPQSWVIKVWQLSIRECSIATARIAPPTTPDSRFEANDIHCWWHSTQWIYSIAKVPFSSAASCFCTKESIFRRLYRALRLLCTFMCCPHNIHTVMPQKHHPHICISSAFLFWTFVLGASRCAIDASAHFVATYHAKRTRWLLLLFFNRLWRPQCMIVYGSLISSLYQSASLYQANICVSRPKLCDCFGGKVCVLYVLLVGKGVRFIIHILKEPKL